MKRQCLNPQCNREYESVKELKFCPKCGEPNKSAPEKVAGEPAAENRVQEGAPARAPTPLGTRDLSSQAPAQKVVLLSGAGEVGAGPGVAGEVKDPEPTTPKQPASEESARARRSANSSYYRSVRALSVTVVISNVLTLSAVVALALNFSSSVERLSKNAQENWMELVKQTAVRDEARDRANSEALRRLEVEFKQDLAATQENMVKAVKEDLDARAAVLPEILNLQEYDWLNRAVTELLGRVKGEARASLLAFRKKLPGSKRKTLINEGQRVVEGIKDKQMKREFKETVLDVLTKKGEATD